MISSKKIPLCALVILFALWSVADEARAERPVQPIDYILLEFLFGVQGAIVGGGLGFYATYWTLSLVQPCPPAQPERRACELGATLIALIVGPNLGIPPGATFLGVALAGAIVGVQGNVLLAFAGSIVGTLLGAAVAGNWVIEPTDFSLVVNPVTMAALGATIGYNIGATIPDNQEFVPTYRFVFFQGRF
ncbi:MAG: hypothetical protein N3E42_05755 [Candidatus Bipolaricaulota bacterium]|nr:hypothetical protein [Candidatus Bipolaricaulota bacterium]